MLILSRKLKESIRIGHDIEIKIVGVHGKIIRLGIDAPREVMVHRQEIYDLIFPGLEAEENEAIV